MTDVARPVRGGWAVRNGRLDASDTYLLRMIKRYRSGARKELPEVIRSLDKALLLPVGEMLPLSARLTRIEYGHGRPRRVNVSGRGDKERLRRVVRNTRPRAFLFREWQGTTKTAEIPLWSYSPTAAEIDELQDALGCQYDAAPAAGCNTRFEGFVADLEHLVELRRQYHSGVSYGIDPCELSPSGSTEACLNDLLLPDWLWVALERLRKTLDAALQPYAETECRVDLETNRQFFHYLREYGEPDDFKSLLTEDDQEMFQVVGLRPQHWREVARLRLGIVANKPEPSEPVARIYRFDPGKRLEKMARPRRQAVAVAH